MEISKVRYIPEGSICAKLISYNISEDNIVSSISFKGGCTGSLTGVCKLLEGYPAEDIISKFSDIKCGTKNSSCLRELTISLSNQLKNKLKGE